MGLLLRSGPARAPDRDQAPPSLVAGAGLAVGCLLGESIAAPAWSLDPVLPGSLAVLDAVRWAGLALLAAASALAWAARRREAPRRPVALRTGLALAALAAGLGLSAGAAQRLLRCPVREAAQAGEVRSHRLRGLVVGVARGSGDAVVVPVLAWREGEPGGRALVRLGLPEGREAPLPGDLVRWEGDLSLPAVQLNPYEYDARRGMARDGVAARSRAVRLDGIGYPPGSGQVVARVVLAPLRLAGWVRSRLAASFQAVLRPQALGLVTAFVLGDDDRLDDRAREAFERTGSLHLAAVSGLHVGLLAAAVAAGLRRLPGRPRPEKLGSSGVVVLFAMLTGMAPPVARAAILVLAATWPARGRRATPASSLGVAAVALLLHSPLAAGQTSLQLSFAATFGIMCSGSGRARPPAGGHPTAPAEGLARRAARWVSASLAAGTAAHLATVPVAVHAFGRFCPWAPLANLVMLPAGSLVIVMSLAAALPAAISPLLLRPLAPALDLAAAALVAAGGLLGRLPASLLEPGDPGPVVIGCASGVVLWSLWTGRRRAPPPGSPAGWRRLGRWMIPAGAILITLLVPWARHRPPRALTAVFFAVGQGDAALIRAGRAAVLVDLGPPGPPGSSGRVRLSPLARRVLPYLRATRVRPALAVITHPHADHVGGLADAMAAWPRLVVYTRAEMVPETARWAGEAGAGQRPDRPDRPDRPEAAGGRIVGLDGPVRLVLPTGWAGTGAGAGSELVLELFWSGTAGRNHLNELSVGILAYQSGHREGAVLLAGDAGFLAEAQWLKRLGPGLDAQVLKVGHHGAAGSSGAPFLAAVSPQVSVVSVGPNRFGHPAPSAWQRLERATSGLVLRTDRDGCITVRLPGDRVQVRTWRGRYGAAA